MVIPPCRQLFSYRFVNILSYGTFPVNGNKQKRVVFQAFCKYNRVLPNVAAPG